MGQHYFGSVPLASQGHGTSMSQQPANVLIGVEMHNRAIFHLSLLCHVLQVLGGILAYFQVDNAVAAGECPLQTSKLSW